MQIGLSKNLRLSLVLISIILIAIISLLLYNQVREPTFKEEQISLYSYKTNSDINYEVFLKPNILFEQESLGEGQIYFTEFVDYIKADLNYGFYGEREADITGDYEIVAMMEGYSKEGEGELVIWKKDFPIFSKKSFDVKDIEMVKSKDITFDLDKYNEFADQIAEATKARTSTRLILYMNVDIKAITDKGMIEEKLSPKLVIPLGQSQFTIEKQQVGEKEGSIQETLQVELPIDKKVVILYSIPIAVFLLAVIYLIFFTFNKPLKTKLEKMVNKIFKNHGSRLVALDEDIINTSDNHYKVRTIEDLVKISDEIEKPILYKYRSNPKNITQFYIVDETSMYLLDLQHLIEKTKEAEDNEEEKEKIEDQV